MKFEVGQGVTCAEEGLALQERVEARVPLPGPYYEDEAVNQLVAIWAREEVCRTD